MSIYVSELVEQSTAAAAVLFLRAVAQLPVCAATIAPRLHALFSGHIMPQTPLPTRNHRF